MIIIHDEDDTNNDKSMTQFIDKLRDQPKVVGINIMDIFGSDAQNSREPRWLKLVKNFKAPKKRTI